jgi:hypothetical protein
MARVGRLAGALVVETVSSGEVAWFLVGDTKVPCDWCAAGFVKPTERDVKRERFVRLAVEGTPALAGTTLAVGLEGEEAARSIAERLTIDRTGSVSERLWRLVVGEDEAEAPSGRAIPAAWLCEMPKPIWDVVRDAVLKCS